MGATEAHSLSIFHDMEQIIKVPTHYPDHHDQEANTLDLFFTANPLYYSSTVFYLLGISDHLPYLCFYIFLNPT